MAEEVTWCEYDEIAPKPLHWVQSQICFLGISCETPTYFYAHQIQELQIGRWAVQGMLFTAVWDRTLYPCRLSNSQKCWFIIYFGVGSVAVYIAVALQYTLITYPFCSGIVLKIHTASREHCGTEWLVLFSADYQHEIPYQETSFFVSKANFATCERCQIYNTTALIRKVYGHLYRCVWLTGTVKAACKTSFLYGPLAT